MATPIVLTYTHLATAFAFLADCEDDAPCGRGDESFPARRPTRFGVYRQIDLGVEPFERDRTPSFEDDVIARLDEQREDEIADSDEEAPRSERPVEVAEVVEVVAPVSVAGPQSASWEALCTHAGMGRRQQVRRIAVRCAQTR